MKEINSLKSAYAVLAALSFICRFTLLKLKIVFLESKGWIYVEAFYISLVNKFSIPTSFSSKCCLFVNTIEWWWQDGYTKKLWAKSSLYLYSHNVCFCWCVRVLWHVSEDKIWACLCFMVSPVDWVRLGTKTRPVMITHFVGR